MVGKLIGGFFNFLLTIIMTIVQLICMPLNALFENLFPDFSTWLTNIQNGLNQAFSTVNWALSIVPPMMKDALLLIFTIELGMLAVMKSSHATAKAWKILQKLKFW